MVEILIDEAKVNGVTEISLAATEMGRALYLPQLVPQEL